MRLQSKINAVVAIVATVAVIEVQIKSTDVGASQGVVDFTNLCNAIEVMEYSDQRIQVVAGGSRNLARVLEITQRIIRKEREKRRRRRAIWMAVRYERLRVLGGRERRCFRHESQTDDQS